MSRCYALVLLVAALITANPSSAQLIIGHRGASHDAPENTMPAFELAWEQGADGIEGDFYLSSDGKIVCIHDADTKRVAGEKLRVAETTYSELRKLDVGAWKGPEFVGTRIPLFKEVAATIPEGKKFYIELKTGPEIVAPLAKALQETSLEDDQILIISFNEETLRECAAQLPNLRTHWVSGYKKSDGVLQPTSKKVIKSLERAAADGFGSKAMPKHFDKAFVSALHKAGFKEFHVWTIDTPEPARFYRQLGAYSITTNRPGWLREQFETSPESP